MPKITASNTKGLLTAYIIKIILSTVFSLFLFLSLFSFITLKLDIDLKALEYFSIAICGLSSLIICIVSTTGFKNNYLALSLISVLPLAVFSVINFCASGQGSGKSEVIKIILIFAIAGVAAIIKSSRKLR